MNISTTYRVGGQCVGSVLSVCGHFTHACLAVELGCCVGLKNKNKQNINNSNNNNNNQTNKTSITTTTTTKEKSTDHECKNKYNRQQINIHAHTPSITSRKTNQPTNQPLKSHAPCLSLVPCWSNCRRIFAETSC